MDEQTSVGRRSFLKMVMGATGAVVMGAPCAFGEPVSPAAAATGQPNILFIMCDQLRFDAIAALGNPHIYTPNIDRLVHRGVSFTNAYSTCPVCVPARYTIRTGCDPLTTGYPVNAVAPLLAAGMAPDMETRCGPYLARTLGGLGYRTFGVGKFHSMPWNEDLGYETHLHSEELYDTPEQRREDDYAAWIAREHPEYDFLEGLMGERTEMYYEPQISPMPAEENVEWWAADRAVEQLARTDTRPYFGLVSFVGPHPPLAPPIPFNRMYDPDRMPNPVRGDRDLDLMDPFLSWMNWIIWAEDVNDSTARKLLARYYGEISYIDHCLGRILDAVEARPDADNTLICFFSDHGDHLGDHSAWQKESFFEQSAHVPFLVSWPARLPRGMKRTELVALTDLFGIATTAAGHPELREGHDVLGLLAGQAPAREVLIGCHGQFGTPWFKVMVREGDWKYIHFANGGGEQLFNLADDPHELRQRLNDSSEVAQRLRARAVAWLAAQPNGRACLQDGQLKTFAFKPFARPTRVYQFDRSRGVKGFPKEPGEVLKDWKFEE